VSILKKRKGKKRRGIIIVIAIVYILVEFLYIRYDTRLGMESLGLGWVEWGGLGFVWDGGRFMV